MSAALFSVTPEFAVSGKIKPRHHVFYQTAIFRDLIFAGLVAFISRFGDRQLLMIVALDLDVINDRPFLGCVADGDTDIVPPDMI